MALFKIIHCPVDFSEFSERALEYAITLGAQSRARLFVQYVMPAVPVASYAHMVPGPFGTGLDESIQGQAQTLLNEQAALTIADRVEWKPVVTTGAAAASIITFAAAEQVDVIVMGTHGRTGIERFLLGSVTEAVIRRAGCPVLVVRQGRSLNPETGTRYREVLVPVDLTEHSDATLEYAVRLAREYQARLFVVHVTATLSAPVIDPAYSEMIADYTEDAREGAADELKRLVDKTVPSGIPVETMVLSGVVASEILRVAEVRGSDLIVMGARDSWVTQLLSIGTTAHRVLSHAVCPVLVLRRQADKLTR